MVTWGKIKRTCFFWGSLINEGDVVFDIGANVGVVSLQLLRDNPHIGKIYAFEPLPSTFAQLSHNLELNGRSRKIVAFNLGLSNKRGSFDFYLPGTSEAASLQPNRDDYYIQESVDGILTGREKIEIIKCEVTTLDEFVREQGIDRVDILKIDTEGNEKAILQGGGMVLEKWHPIVYSELLRKHAARFGYHPNEVLAFLRRLGYQCFVLHGEELSPFAEMSDETVETNFFFLTDEHLIHL